MLLVMTLLLQSSVDKMMQKANNSMMVGSSSWLDQFTEAFTVQAGELPEGRGWCLLNICKHVYLLSI